MSISQQFVPARFTANGTQRQWSFEFSLPQGAVVVGYLTSPQGEVSKITENMSVDLLNHTYTYPTEASGLAPLAQGWKITLIRQTPCTQEIQLTEQDALPYASLEEGLDKLTYLMQETQETLGRSIQFPCTQTTPQTDAEAYIQNIQTIANQASSSATAAQNSAGVAAQYAQSAQQDYTTLAADLASLQTTVHNNQIADQTYANSVASHALTVAEAYCDSKLASEETARTAADNLKQDKLTVAQQNAVDSGVTASVVAQVQTNRENITALDAELDENRPWQKPSEWVDIRSGALANSIYFLVGHAADYSKYRYITINATVSTAANTYDVFVDGVKQFTTASGSDTAIDWQTLNLSSGFDVTYPETLKTHIVRVTPTTDSDTFSAFRTKEVSGVSIQGCLWMHVTASDTINYEQLFGGWAVSRGAILEAVTTSQETLKGNKFKYAFTGCKKLIETPVLEGLANQDMDADSSFTECHKIKKIRLKNFKNTKFYRACYNCYALQDFITENCEFTLDINQFYACSKLKNLPSYFKLSSNGASTPLPYNAPIADCIVDLSVTPTTTFNSQFVILGGSSTNKLSYLKGLVLNDQMSLTSAATTAVDVAYTGMERWALIALFNSLPTVSGDIVCKITGATGASDLTADDLAIATNKGWTVTR